MNKLFYLCFTILLSGCATIQAPPEFEYKELKTNTFTLAAWQKSSFSENAYKIYIEGDGHAFNSHGMPTNDPTPKGEMMRELAYGDNSPNVIYLARPCQYVKSPLCSTKYWTTARFSSEVVDAEYHAIKQIVGSRPIILIGFSGGAQIAELLAATTDLNIKKIITIAGNIDHAAWTAYQKLPPLNNSLNAADYKDKLAVLPQKHYVGTKDKVIPPALTRSLVNHAKIIEVQGADHNDGWKDIYPLIWQEQ